MEEELSAEAAAEAEVAAAWKDELRLNFEAWLDDVEALPPPDPEAEEEDVPDLYAFYQDLAAATAESRKANRRTAEAMSQWSETLARFEEELVRVAEAAPHATAGSGPDPALSRAHCLILIELADRLRRLARGAPALPVRRWWGNDDSWRQAWTRQSEGLAIVLSHVETWLQKEGVTRMPVLHQPFDPTTMVAVAVESDASRPAQTVTEEVVTGYQREGDLLRLAQVKVTVNPPSL